MNVQPESQGHGEAVYYHGPLAALQKRLEVESRRGAEIRRLFEGSQKPLNYGSTQALDQDQEEKHREGRFREGQGGKASVRRQKSEEDRRRRREEAWAQTRVKRALDTYPIGYCLRPSPASTEHTRSATFAHGYNSLNPYAYPAQLYLGMSLEPPAPNSRKRST